MMACIIEQSIDQGELSITINNAIDLQMGVINSSTLLTRVNFLDQTITKALSPSKPFGGQLIFMNFDE